MFDEKMPPTLIHRLEVLSGMTVESPTYTNMIEAMGMKKFMAYSQGEALKVDSPFRQTLKHSGFYNARYSEVEYVNKDGVVEHSLFVDQTINGVGMTIELDNQTVDKRGSKYFKAKHVYVKLPNGVITDLADELPADSSILYSADDKSQNFYDLESNDIYLGDYKDTVLNNGTVAGLPVYLHEIGHLKHMMQDPSARREINSDANKMTKILARVGISPANYSFYAKKLGVEFIPYLNRIISEQGQVIMDAEMMASDWARKWSIEKSGSDSLVDPALSVAYAGYKSVYSNVDGSFQRAGAEMNRLRQINEKIRTLV